MISMTEQVVSDYLSLLLPSSVQSEATSESPPLFLSAVPIDQQLVVVSQQLAGAHCLVAALQLLSMVRVLPESRLQQFCLQRAGVLLGTC
ncbi:hypothetical protein [Gynuella sunshinyii]|uniref:Uncharacterized protein n=1 Tax=Gynuella sunshinyii YC6258 TaxID=1445510 RepID=A0A0C5VXN1_9GAMM|nr:hypothetical protein [Gynuella sunshinyii]AJQ95164.1 hypothetical Protein YC6258_03128 [Gynuella sunshinyii YC6258]